MSFQPIFGSLRIPVVKKTVIFKESGYLGNTWTLFSVGELCHGDVWEDVAWAQLCEYMDLVGSDGGVSLFKLWSKEIVRKALEGDNDNVIYAFGKPSRANMWTKRRDYSIVYGRGLFFELSRVF